MSRGAMTMRAVVSRSPTQTDDDWGRPGPPVHAATGDSIPCRAWSKRRVEVRDDGKEIVVEDLRAIVPKAADIQEGDRLVIQDRLGAVLFGGPVAVRSSARKGQSASVASHRELMLTRHTTQ